MIICRYSNINKVIIIGQEKTLQEAINDNGGDFGGISQINCGWINGNRCQAAGTTQSTCLNNKFVAGVRVVGCSADGCNDATRCRRVDTYCCG